MPEWFTLEQAADRLGLEVATVFAAVVAGWVPHIYVGGRFLVADWDLGDLVLA